MSRNGILRQTALIEDLEKRKLLSTLDVADFGAVLNDGADDRQAILTAIRESKPGDTIVFGNGILDLSDRVVLASDRTYVGLKSATLRGRSSEGQLLEVLGNNVTITGLTLEGGGIFIERPGGGFNENITIHNNVFRLDTSGSHNGAITFTSGLRDSRITNNDFTGYNGGGFGIYGYNYNGLTIANNDLVDITAGMHIDAFRDSGNLLVKENYMSGLKGMGMEFQSRASNLKFFDNYYEKPNLSSDYNRNKNSFAFSLILDKSSDIQIKRNTVIAPERPDGVGTRIAFEVGGDNTLVEENYVNGVNHVLASNDGVGSSSITLRNNKFMNYRQGIGGIRPGAIRYEGKNDGSTDLSWDINREKPGRYKPQDSKQARKAKKADNTASSLGAAEISANSASEAFIFISDMKWVSATNSWGPAERDQTNGERAEGDGDVLVLEGKEYEKGVGVAADSEIVIDLDGEYSRFFSDIGINDRVGPKGSATFEVWADGEKVYDSGVLTGNAVKKGVTVKVDGVKELKLVTTNAGDGDRHDHADWAGARLQPKNANATD